MELVWLRAIRIRWPLVSLMTVRSILCDMVLVKSTSKSGDPMFFILPTNLVYTFALQSYDAHNSLYRRSMHSFPPTITTLMTSRPFKIFRVIFMNDIFRLALANHPE